jgi:hypothetical protein
MATFRGISAIGTAILSQLDDAWARDPFDATALSTSLIRADDLAKRPTEFGITLYVFRVSVNGTQRTSPPAVAGRRRPLPVEVEFILTPWAKSAQRELELLGWCMRVLDDEPLLSAAALNAAVPGVFASTEVVEIVPSHLSGDEYFRLWDALPWGFQLSIAFAARLVRLESERRLTEAGPVLERDLELGDLVAP